MEASSEEHDQNDQKTNFQLESHYLLGTQMPVQQEKRYLAEHVKTFLFQKKWLC